MESINQTIIEAQVIEALRTCFDPEIPVNIYELGLIYQVEVRRRRGGGDSNDADLAALSGGAIDAGRDRSKGADDCRVLPMSQIDLVWEPPWDQSKMSEAARLQLGMM